jgi:hypothetical protein
MKPTLFVASSTEGLRLARGLQAGLRHVADGTVWDQGVFSPGTITLDVLIEMVAASDFGVFVFSPDDLLRLRDQESAAVRDNVLFEFGLFISKLGRKRVFMLLPENSSLHLPTDLAGLAGATYDPASLNFNANVQAVLGPACFAIENAIRKEWTEPAGLTGDLVLLLRYLNRDDGTWITPEYYVKDMAVFNGAPEQADHQTTRGWMRSVRYQMLCLDLQGLVEVNQATSIMYRISNKGRKILELLAAKPAYARIFQHQLGPLKLPDWGQTAVGPGTPRQQLSGNDYRLLFAVYDRPGTYISAYESAIEQPASTPLLERAKRLEELGFIHVLPSNELDITAKGRDLVGPIKAVADQVYGRRQG